MRESNQLNSNINRLQIDKKLLPIIVIFAITAIIGLSVFGLLDGFTQFRMFYIIPWILMTALVIAIPNVYLIYKKEFSLAHPIVSATYSYFAPAFVVGGFILATGYSDPYFLYHIKDPEYTFPLFYIVVMLGFGGLSLGYFLPIGRLIGEFIKKYLPTPKWKEENLYLPGLILLGTGIFFTTFAYVVGVLGFQMGEEVGTYDGLIFLTTLLWFEASFLLWLLLFRRAKFDIFSFLIGAVLIAITLTKALFAGNRSSLIQVMLMITLAYVLAGRKITLKKGIIITILAAVSLMVGMMYGTAFRNVKQSQSRVSIERYTELIFETFDNIQRKDNLKFIESGFESLSYRIVESGTCLAVVIAKYQELKPYEEGYDLDNNISKDLVTTFIPRFIWTNKPVASDPRLYSELYFDYGETSFAITPMGDLIRNFGFIGVPLGMMLLGIILRIIHESLITNQPFSVWRRTLYYMLLTTVSYESFYGTIFPFLVKFGVFAVLGLLIINLFVRKSEIN